MKMTHSQPQPAYKMYAFDRGWRILKYVTENLFKRTHIAACYWFHKASEANRYGIGKHGFILYCMYMAQFSCYLAGAVQYVSAMALAGLLLLLYTLLLATWAGTSLALIGLLVLCTFAYFRVYSIFFRCPDCHKDMPIPTFLCPVCGTEHTRLWPGIYGIVSHQCKVCNTRLATVGLKIPGYKRIERHKLARICPHCHHPLNPGIGQGTNLHIPVVGGPQVGKTNFIVMATREFRRMYEKKYGYRISFTDERHEREFEANLQMLDTGRELKKTPDIVPQAYNLKISAPRAIVPKLAYIYDAAGEAFNTSENTGRQEYYKYIDGIIFVIDPFAISEYHRLHELDIERLRDVLRPSMLDVMQAYERMIQMFEASVGFHKGRRFPHPIAIVMTKVDALELEHEIGASAVRRAPEEHWNLQDGSRQEVMNVDNPSISEEDAISALVRDFLCYYGLDNFVRDVEAQFANVRYFSCSALGRMPSEDDSRAFVPVRVADPLIWVLSQTRAIKSPQRRTNGNGTTRTRPPIMKQKVQEITQPVRFPDH